MNRYEVKSVEGNPTDPGGRVITFAVSEKKYSNYKARRRREKRRLSIALSLLAFFMVFLAVLIIGSVISLSRQEVPKNHAKNLPQIETSAELTVEVLPTVETVNVEEEPTEVEKQPDFYNPAIPLSYEKQEMLYKAAEEFDVPYNLAIAVVWKETNFKNVKGDGGRASGYFQIWKKWHSDRMAKLGVSDLMDAEGNFRVGCSILGDLLRAYKDTHKALMVYNGGASGASELWAQGYTSTGYSRAVVEYMEGIV